MRDLVTEGKRDFRIRKLLAKIIKSCSPKDYSCYAESVFNYCQNNIKYVFDPNGVELIEAPWKVVESGIADCDSIVVLLASLLENAGLACRFVTIKADKLRSDEFSHVFLECKVPGRGWVPMDATMHDRPFGWSPDQNFPRKNWPASRDEPEAREGEGDEMSGYSPSRLSGMSYLNQVPAYDSDSIPGVEDTVGVHVGHKWAWRMEPMAVHGTPEELELSALRRGTGPEEMPTQSFFIRDDAQQVIAQKQAEMRRQDGMYAEEAVVVTKVPSVGKPWLLLGAVILGAYLLGRR
jgi:hypothetical protein